MTDTEPEILVLDAMDVIYEVGDDVADLLVPFISEKGGSNDETLIDALYHEASLGRLSAEEFWRRVGLSAELEDEYLARHNLSDGALEMLDAAPLSFEKVVCLSNDLSQWSRKLRKTFQLEGRFADWYISGDLGLRKPDPAIYQRLLADLQTDPGRIVFVDDRAKNLDPAGELGIQTVHYHVSGPSSGGRHRTVGHLAELLQVVS